MAGWGCKGVSGYLSIILNDPNIIWYFLYFWFLDYFTTILCISYDFIKFLLQMFQLKSSKTGIHNIV